jgi:hypothetical protein
MLEQITLISSFIIKAFLHIWPYLLITIPISVAVNMSGAAKHINKTFKARPLLSILLAALVGAFSPFCSCGVIPIIASLLIAGVPLAPVMTFWIASPSMDPEMFVLSAAMLGWNLAIWRLASTLVLSLSAGYITHYIWRKGWLGDTFVKLGAPTKTQTASELIKNTLYLTKDKIQTFIQNIFKEKKQMAIETDSCCIAVPLNPVDGANSDCGCNSKSSFGEYKLGCCDEPDRITKETPRTNDQKQSCSRPEKKKNFYNRLYKEIIKSTLMVAKFMMLAFFLEALIVLYIPQNLIMQSMGNQNIFSVFWAALIGVPVYTSNLSALPMIGGLLQQGMNPGAALAFLISGPITTIPAMAAVRGLTTKKVFYLYVSFAFFGALFFGYLFYIVNLFL